VEPDELGRLAFIEMTAHGFACALVKLAEIVGSVKIDSPTARAMKPPSGASSTTNTISLIRVNDTQPRPRGLCAEAPDRRFAPAGGVAQACRRRA
jgi:hypothetical protein